jgi:hypothetical protein
VLRLSLTALTLLIIFCAPCAARPVADDAAEEVPFTFEKGFVIVHAKVKGSEPVEVIVATGAEHSVADFGVGKKYKLQAYYSGLPPVTGYNDRTFSYYKVPDVYVGTAHASLDMWLGSTTEAAKAIGRDIFGIIGSDFFKGRVVQFDFQKKVMRFLKRSAADEAKDASGAGELIMLPMVMSADPYKQNLTVPAVEKVSFNGKPGKLLLDTGMVAVVALTSSAAKKLGFNAPPDKGEPRTDSIGSLRLGSYEMTGVPVKIYAKGTGADDRLGEHGAVAGSVFLQNFISTFDFRNKVVILEHI